MVFVTQEFRRNVCKSFSNTLYWFMEEIKAIINKVMQSGRS
jgi:hypothetical protein